MAGSGGIRGRRRSRALTPPDSESEGGSGTLYVVATPIGNLADITHRAVEVLRACPVVAAEDTRRLRVLAGRYGFSPRRVVRCDERTEETAAGELLRALRGGEDVALTSDAGTPGISDPGFRLVRRARAEGIRVVPVPGASAPVAALSASGLPSDRFLFAGFPPRRAAPLRAFLEPLLARPETLLLLESPARILALLEALATLAPERRVVVARELTKVHEELIEGRAAELREVLAAGGGRVRGELVVLVAGAPGAVAVAAPAAILSRPWVAKLSRRDLADLLAVACGLDRNAAYRLAHLPARDRTES
jgi:16S rRNA (cytidine1402-2'-O)-methyltransferase